MLNQKVARSGGQFEEDPMDLANLYNNLGGTDSTVTTQMQSGAAVALVGQSSYIVPCHFFHPKTT
jgi:hypothetical protein